MSQGSKRRFILNVLFIITVLGVLYFVLTYVLAWFLPFLIAFLIATLLQKPINGILEHSGLNRRVIAPIVTAVLVALVLTALGFLLVKLISQTAAFIVQLPDVFNTSAPAFLEAVQKHFEGLVQRMPDAWESGLRQTADELVTSIEGQLSNISKTVVSWTANKAVGIPSALIGIVVTIVATFFMTSSYEQIKVFTKRQIPDRYLELAEETWSTFGHTLTRMLQSYLLIMFITFVELALGLTILRVNYSVVIAAFVALVDILPVLGTGTVLIPWGVAACIMGNLRLGIGILLLYLVITVVRSILEPRIIGQRIGLHPLVTLIAMYLGLKLLGIAGMFLFPLVLILVKNAQEIGMFRIWKE